MPESIDLLVLIAGLALLAWAVYGQLMKDPAAPLTDKLAMIGQAVAAAEQLYRSNQLGAGKRLGYALDLIEQWYPDMEIEEATAHVEAAVFWLKEHGGQVLTPGELPEPGDDDDDDGDLGPLGLWRGQKR